MFDLKVNTLNIKMSTSILESEYVEPTRPYSCNELKHMRENLYKSLRLGNIRACHKRCNHFYKVKENGRKEKEIIENENPDFGNCSVCWKISKTPRHLKARAKGLVEVYSQTFLEDPKVLTYDNIDVETIFYKWLYLDN